MSDDGKNPEEIIEGVIKFINRERELFGDFSVNPPGKKSSYEKEPDNNGIEEKTDKGVKKTVQSAEYTPENLNIDLQHSSSELYQKIGSCDTLVELEKLCLTAEVLQTDLKDTQLVFGVGNPDADLMLIGEAPGAEEDKQGEPFVGAAGQLLNKIMAAINFKRDDIYIGNILKHRPPNNRNPLPIERKRSLPFLLRQIDLVNPKLILALGKVSAQTLLDSNQSLGSMRGRFHKFRDKYHLMATYHPAALLRNPNWKRPTWKDVQMLREKYDELGGKP